MVYFCVITEEKNSVIKEYLNVFKNINLISHPLLCNSRSVSRNSFKYMVPHVSGLGTVLIVLSQESQSDCFSHELISEKAFDFGFMRKSFSVCHTQPKRVWWLFLIFAFACLFFP